MLEAFTKDRDESEPLFLSIYKNRLDRTQAYRIINNACKIARISYNIGIHSLRKTFGYHHYQKFKDIALLQKIFNQFTPQVTLQYIGIEQYTIDDSYKNFVL